MLNLVVEAVHNTVVVTHSHFDNVPGSTPLM